MYDFRELLLRMAASINDGYGSATFLLERFGSAARNSRLHRAGTQWGHQVLERYLGRLLPSVHCQKITAGAK